MTDLVAAFADHITANTKWHVKRDGQDILRLGYSYHVPRTLVILIAEGQAFCRYAKAPLMYAGIFELTAPDSLDAMTAHLNDMHAKMYTKSGSLRSWVPR